MIYVSVNNESVDLLRIISVIGWCAVVVVSSISDFSCLL